MLRVAPRLKIVCDLTRLSMVAVSRLIESRSQLCKRSVLYNCRAFDVQHEIVKCNSFLDLVPWLGTSSSLRLKRFSGRGSKCNMGRIAAGITIYQLEGFAGFFTHTEVVFKFCDRNNLLRCCMLLLLAKCQHLGCAHPRATAGLDTSQWSSGFSFARHAGVGWAFVASEATLTQYLRPARTSCCRRWRLVPFRRRTAMILRHVSSAKFGQGALC